MRKKVSMMVAGGIELIAVLVLVVLFFLIDREVTFEEGFDELKEIDEKYNTSFHVEMLNGTMVAKDDIPLMLEELKEFEGSLSASSSPEMDALFLFVDIRKLMLTSQWYFQLGEEIGDVGLVNDESGFSCGESQDILNAAFYFNESFAYGFQAEEEIDELLYINKYHPTLWKLVGVDDQKTRFFKSDLKYIRHIPLNNLKSLEVYCGIAGVKQETTLTKKFEYARELVPKEVWIEKYGAFNERI